MTEYSISASVVADSVSPQGSRLITLEIELPRFILSQFNTHRMISKNFQSSRAVPVKKIIEQVMDNPVVPVHWGKNQAGMVADGEVEGWDIEGGGRDLWLKARDRAVEIASQLNEQGYHKQIVNRILEPFMWQKGIVSATEETFSHFFSLRIHNDAQPEIRELAEKMRKSIVLSSPKKLDYGDWHLPYVGEENFQSLNEAIKVSVSCCAQVSYRKRDDSLEKAIKIYDMLNLPVEGVWPEDPPHASPTEHVAMCSPINGKDNVKHNGNFHSSEWYQLRKMYERGTEKLYINV